MFCLALRRFYGCYLCYYVMLSCVLFQSDVCCLLSWFSTKVWKSGYFSFVEKSFFGFLTKLPLLLLLVTSQGQGQAAVGYTCIFKVNADLVNIPWQKRYMDPHWILELKTDKHQIQRILSFNRVRYVLIIAFQRSKYFKIYKRGRKWLSNLAATAAARPWSRAANGGAEKVRLFFRYFDDWVKISWVSKKSKYKF